MNGEEIEEEEEKMEGKGEGEEEEVIVEKEIHSNKNILNIILNEFENLIDKNNNEIIKYNNNNNQLINDHISNLNSNNNNNILLIFKKLEEYFFININNIPYTFIIKKIIIKKCLLINKIYYKLRFICPITKKYVKCGINGNGILINEKLFINNINILSPFIGIGYAILNNVINLYFNKSILLYNYNNIENILLNIINTYTPEYIKDIYNNNIKYNDKEILNTNEYYYILKNHFFNKLFIIKEKLYKFINKIINNNINLIGLYQYYHNEYNIIWISKEGELISNGYIIDINKIKNKLLDIYKKYCPNDIKLINNILLKYKGNEIQLINEIENYYKIKNSNIEDYYIKK